MYSNTCFVKVLIVFTLVIIENECKRPNFILFLTDDQDLLLDSMIPMQSTIKNIANDGITFTEAYAHSPICCPSRSSLLTGKYLHNIHVYNNSINGNCSSNEWQNTHETRTIASYLKSSGYVNFYAGKYLNQYGNKNANGLSHIPPGYDWWYGLEGNSKYHNFTLSINGTKVDFHQEYLTDLIGTYALDFLSHKPLDKEFFMILAPPAAHAPFTPANRHSDKFPTVKTKKMHNFNASATKKHWITQLPPKYLPEDITILDDIQRKRWQTLLSVDELVENVVNKLKNLNILDETYLIFTSDNGFHIGQFGLPWDKRQPYQTDIHIPFLMKGPKLPKKELFNHPVSLVDLAPTILTLANATVPEDMDGISFAHLFNSQDNKNKENERNLVFIEYFGEGNAHSVEKACNFSEEDAENLSECSLENWCKCQDSRNNTYTCTLTFNIATKTKYCLFRDKRNFMEFYNLVQDPYELNNKAPFLTSAEHRNHQHLLSEYKKCTGKSCHDLVLKNYNKI